MSERPGYHVADHGGSSHLRTLTILAVLSACLYGIIALLSWRFEFDSPTVERPIIAVLLMFAVAFIAYLFAIRLVTRVPQDRRLLTLIVWPAILFRLTLLFSIPIQEIDIYRYLWDGAASVASVSPFRYSPKQVREADANAENQPELARLVELRDQQPALAEILRRVHFGELPTIYPSTSQVVFAAATLTTPTAASVLVRVFVMKTWLVIFDLATLALIVGLLRLCHKPIGLCIIYAWCPLLLKEVANSGHLDAVAVFLTTLSVYLAARMYVNKLTASRSSVRAIANSSVVAVCLALAIGAKLYPVVLAPLIFTVLTKSVGWRRILVPIAVFVTTTLILISPMLPRQTPLVAKTQQQTTPLVSDMPPLPDENDPSRGVATFLRSWEMNDFIFLIIIENLKPTANLSQKPTAWFSVVPEKIREQVVAFATARFGLGESDAPFIVTRALTVMLFLVLASWFAWRAARTTDITRFCEASFLTLAWFWLLCPTQNPWYWTWALPLLPFARNRAWLAVSGLVLLYYLRFWLSYHWPNSPILGSGYIGSTFFDFIVTWIEFGPWFMWLALESFMFNRRRYLSRQQTPAWNED